MSFEVVATKAADNEEGGPNRLAVSVPRFKKIAEKTRKKIKPNHESKRIFVSLFIYLLKQEEGLPPYFFRNPKYRPLSQALGNVGYPFKLILLAIRDQFGVDLENFFELPTNEGDKGNNAIKFKGLSDDGDDTDDRDGKIIIAVNTFGTQLMRAILGKEKEGEEEWIFYKREKEGDAKNQLLYYDEEKRHYEINENFSEKKALLDKLIKGWEDFYYRTIKEKSEQVLKNLSIFNPSAPLPPLPAAENAEGDALAPAEEDAVDMLAVLATTLARNGVGQNEENTPEEEQNFAIGDLVQKSYQASLELHLLTDGVHVYTEKDFDDIPFEAGGVQVHIRAHAPTDDILPGTYMVVSSGQSEGTAVINMETCASKEYIYPSQEADQRDATAPDAKQRIIDEYALFRQNFSMIKRAKNMDNVAKHKLYLWVMNTTFHY